MADELEPVVLPDTLKHIQVAASLAAEATRPLVHALRDLGRAIVTQKEARRHG
jgi:hypothetical protein